MLTLVFGGSASGKSEYAEQHVLGLEGPRVYIATMEPFGEEAQARIRKHRTMRADKGFETIECAVRLQEVSVLPDSNVLLEDLGNLLANEMFSPSGGGSEAVIAGIDSLLAKCRNLTIVSNDIFSEGAGYTGEVTDYMRELAEINRKLASKADRVTEVICGLPNILKTVKEGEEQT